MKHPSLILDWFRRNEMKPNDDKCHLIFCNRGNQKLHALVRISKYLNENKKSHNENIHRITIQLLPFYVDVS